MPTLFRPVRSVQSSLPPHLHHPRLSPFLSFLLSWPLDDNDQLAAARQHAPLSYLILGLLQLTSSFLQISTNFYTFGIALTRRSTHSRHRFRQLRLFSGNVLCI